MSLSKEDYDLLFEALRTWEGNRAARRERSVLLQARLIAMRDAGLPAFVRDEGGGPGL